MPDEINAFRGDYAYLSNFYRLAVPIDIGDGILCPTVEHAYQASKTTDLAVRNHLAGLRSPGLAKRAGRAEKVVTLRDNWDGIKVQVMHELVTAKFRNNPDIAAKLLATGDANLVEGNTWGDRFWGVYLGQGQNKLGEILMQVRSELPRE